MIRHFEAGEQIVPPGESWVLVVGGVTRPGNRRARRVAAKALARGLDVVWLDGFEETHPDTGARVPVDVDEPKGDLTSVGYVDAEEATASGRMRIGAGLRSNPITRWMWKLLLRRVGTILRPSAGWKAVRPTLGQLDSAVAPRNIVYCDDYAITIAWNAGRMWTNTTISTDLDTRKS